MASDVFEIFKMVLGIIIAAFFLYFMLQFAGMYTQSETKTAEIQEYNNLKKLIGDTYIYNIPTAFDLRTPPLFARPPYISEGSNVILDQSLLFFFRPRKDMSDIKSAPEPSRLIVYKGTADYGFWTMDFVGAIPEMRIIYNPVELGLAHYSLIHSITSLFTQSVDPRISFGFCGSNDKDGKDTGKSNEYTLDYMVGDQTYNTIANWAKARDPNKVQMPYEFTGLCTKDFEQPKTKVIITNNNIQTPQTGFLVNLPATGKIGKISFKEKDPIKEEIKEYNLAYKDALDIFAVIVGGFEAYKFKNKLMFEGLLSFSKSEAKRATLLSGVFSDDQSNKKYECVKVYKSLKSKLGDFQTHLENMIKLEKEKADYNSALADSATLMGLMDEINKIYDELKKKACE